MINIDRPFTPENIFKNYTNFADWKKYPDAHLCKFMELFSEAKFTAADTIIFCYQNLFPAGQIPGAPYYSINRTNSNLR